MITRAGLIGLYAGTILAYAFFCSPYWDPFMGFVLAAVLVGFGYHADRPGEESGSGCMLAGVTSVVGLLCAVVLSRLVGDPSMLLVPVAMLIILAWASPSGMPLWHLLGLLVWLGLCYRRWPEFSGPTLAALLGLVTGLYIIISGLRRKFPWLEREPAPPPPPAPEVHNPWER